MRNVILDIDEVILIHGECLDLRQPMAYAGVLTVTNKRVHFAPSRINRAIGASEWELAHERIDRIRLGGLRPVMSIMAGAATLRVMGQDVKFLYERLRALHDHQNGEVLESALYEPGERILFRGEVALELSRFIWVTGWVTLTDRRFRFNPRRKLEQLIWQKAGIDSPLSIIRAGRLDVVRKRLQLRIKNKIVVFRGNSLPRLYAFMNVLARDGGDGNLSDVVSASLHRGALAQRGQLATTTNRLLFVSSGAIEAVVGTREELDLQLRDIRRIQVEGKVDPRFVVHLEDTRHEFSVQNPVNQLMSLVAPLLQTDGWSDPPCVDEKHSISLVNAETLLADWLPRLGINPSLILCAGPAVHLASKPGVRRGWILLTATEVIFLPVGGGKSRERPVVMETQMLIPPLDEDGTNPQLGLTANGATIRVLPRGGSEFVEHFWEIWRDERLKVLEVTRDKIRQRRLDQKNKRRDDGGFNRREVYRAVFTDSQTCIITTVSDNPDEMNQHIEVGIINLSEGGICVSSAESFSVDQEVLLRFDNEIISGVLPGRIAHYRKMGKKRFRLGIEFVDIEIDLQLSVRNAVMGIQREDLALRAEMIKG